MQKPRCLPGKRIADEDIYLRENRHHAPKQIFVDLADLIAQKQWASDARLLDVGCATGEMITYLKERHPSFRFRGIDISAAMIEEARRQHPGTEFRVGDALDPSAAAGAEADILTMSGVLNCFDEPAAVLRNLVGWTAPGGRIIVLDIVNDEPIDVIVRHRRALETEQPWEIGWNIFARASLERALSSIPRVAAFDIVPFRLPFKLPKRDRDPMRTWTIETEDNARQLVNGARQMVDLAFIVIDVS